MEKNIPLVLKWHLQSILFDTKIRSNHVGFQFFRHSLNYNLNSYDWQSLIRNTSYRKQTKRNEFV